ncbi:hydrophobic surface binding protein A domain-containing protein [Trichoderma chlorosporum]
MMNFAKFLLLASTAAAIILPRDALTVDTDINQKLGPLYKTLDNDVKAYPASGLPGALAIHDDVQTLVAVTQNTTSDVKASGSFSEADGTTILQDIQALVSTILGSLSAFQDQVPAWANIPGGTAVVLNDLQSLNTTSINFFNALITAAPAGLIPSFTSIKTQIVGGFNSAIAAYSS